MTLDLDAARVRLGLAPLPPKVELPTYEGDEPERGPRSEENEAIDKLLDGLTIIEAYNRWANKGVVDPGNKTESVMIRCPDPAHPDEKPSAAINTDKQVYDCYGCNAGGDKYRIAAFRFGFGPDYQSKENFPKLRRAMAEDLGLVTVRAPSGNVVVAFPEPELPEPELPDDDVDEPEQLAPVVEMPSLDSDPEPVLNIALDYEAIFKPGTFIYEYVKLCSADDVAMEFHIANAISCATQAIGLDAQLVDEPTVKANLFSVLLGDSGSGKSKSLSVAERLLAIALPYDHQDPGSKGCRLMPTPASAEVLVDYFSKPEVDPMNPKLVVRHNPVRGLVMFRELADLVGKSNRMGNILKPTMMEFYDCYSWVRIASRTHGTAEAADPFCSIISTTQTKSIGTLLTNADADSGFLNRFLIWVGNPKTRIAIGGIRLDISPLVPLLKGIQQWAGTPKREIVLDEDADRIFKEWFYAEYVPVTKGDENPLLTRCDLTIKKLATIMACNEHTTVVTGEMMERVLIFWPYMKAVYQFLGVRLGETESYRIGEAVKKALHEFADLGVQPSVRDLYERKLKRRFKNKGEIVKVLGFMVSLGEIEEIATKSKGRAVIRYRLGEASS